jgi:hypothetical protein
MFTPTRERFDYKEAEFMFTKKKQGPYTSRIFSEGGQNSTRKIFKPCLEI